MDANLLEIKGNLEKVLDILENYDEDTTPERIKIRRVALGFFNRDRERMRRLVSGYPVAVTQFFQGLDDLFYSYFHYFDLGYKADMGISELTPTLKSRIKLAVEKINLL